MHTIQIADEVLEDYKNIIGIERFEFLVEQAKDQLKEISQNGELYNSYLEKIKIAGKVDDLVLWILFFSNENICSDYIKQFKKDFFDMVPENDLADLFFYIVYLKKCKNNELDGIVYLVESNDKAIEDVDQSSFMNVLCHIQKQKQPEIDFNSF